MRVNFLGSERRSSTIGALHFILWNKVSNLYFYVIIYNIGNFDQYIERMHKITILFYPLDKKDLASFKRCLVYKF